MKFPKARKYSSLFMLKMWTNYMGFFEFFLVFFFFLFLFSYSSRSKNGLPTHWPLVGMLPAILKNHLRIHDFVIEIMEKSQLTFILKGPWFTNMNLLVTVDPANLNHILSKNFGNYIKGSKFKEIFEALGDGVFSTDSDIWQYHRKMAQSVLARPQFHQFLVEKIWEKIEIGLIPILDHASKQRLEIDLKDLLGRFTFDITSVVIMDYDPGTLCIDLPNHPFLKALHGGEEAIVYRHLLPTCIWKFQRWLDIGREKNYREGWEIIDEVIYACISRKREQMSKNPQVRSYNAGNKVRVDLITLYIDEVRDSVEIGSDNDKFLRDTVLTYLSAGLETTSASLSWFFYLLSNNSHVLSKIKDELNAMIEEVKDQQGYDRIIWDPYNVLSTNFEELVDKLIYLHAAICEALRLYPAVAFNAKAPVESDTLPSGHKVYPGMQIIFDLYAMGRMKSIWGEDCYEFRPERWISETGKFMHEPSYKFSVFSSGPRICIGKSMSLTIMKAATIAIISKYNIEPVQGYPVVPELSVVLHMKDGFKVKVNPNY